MKLLKKVSIIFFILILISFVLSVPAVMAGDDDEQGLVKVDVEKFPELSCTKYSVCEEENLLDSNSPNYDPSLRYGEEGTRFGPPGKQNFDFYRNLDEKANAKKAMFGKELPAPDHIQYGTQIYNNGNVEIVQAYQKIYPTLSLAESGDVLYAPTLMGTSYCRLESLAYYVRAGATTDRLWRVYEHSTTTPGSGSFICAYNMSASFCTRYGGGANEIITRIEKVVDGFDIYWYVYLYDRTDSEWDQIAYSYYVSTFSYGWDAWESYNLENNWPTLPEISSRYLLVVIGGTPYYVTSTYGTIVDDTPVNFPYSTDMVSNYYHWTVGP